ncbi:MAG: oligosaccharide flippase family protein [bacterium]|nr:oligosaccharide flippase family protein [bacterium]
MIDHLKQLWRHKFVQGGVLLTVTSIIVNILNYLFNLFAARGLGPSGYGELAAIFAYVMILSTATTVISTIVIRKLGQVGQYRLVLAKELVDWFWHRLGRWLALPMAGLFLIKPLSRLLNLEPISVVFLITISIIGLASSFYTAVFSGLKLFWLLAGLAILTTTIKLLGGISAVTGLGGLDLVLAFLIFSGLLGLVLNALFFKLKTKNLKPTTSFNLKLASTLRSPAFLTTTATVLGLVLLSNLDVIFVKKFTDSYTTGLYGVWSLWAKIILYFLAPLSGLTLIFVSSKEHQSQKNKLLAASLLITFALGISALIGYRLFGHWLILFIYGPKFINIAPYLWLSAIFGLFYAGINVLTNFYLAQKDKISLVVPLIIPVQTAALFFFRTNLLAIMWVETISSFLVFAVFLIYWLIKHKPIKA